MGDEKTTKERRLEMRESGEMEREFMREMRGGENMEREFMR